MNPGIFGASGGSALRSIGAPTLTIEFMATQTWTVPDDGFIDVMAIGAGGSGAIAIDNTNPRATGGSSGGVAIKRKRVYKGQQIVLTIPAGGSSVGRGGVGVSSGFSGGTLTVSGAGINITIPGGAGGQAIAGTTAIASATPSVPTGGDINFPGGVAGGIAANANAFPLATGGACPGIARPGSNSGSITTAPASATATGGAGFGGSSPDASGIGTGGSGSGGVGVGAVGGAATLGVSAAGVFSFPTSNNAGSTAGSNTAAAGIGAGSGSVAQSGNTNSSTGASTLGGTGAIASASISSTTATAGAVTIGGGSGGIALQGTLVGSSAIGKGGDGLVVVAFYPSSSGV